MASMKCGRRAWAAVLLQSPVTSTSTQFINIDYTFRPISSTILTIYTFFTVLTASIYINYLTFNPHAMERTIPLLIARGYVLDDDRPLPPASKLESMLPVEILHSIIGELDVISRIHLALCNTFLLKVSVSSLRFDFRITNMTDAQLAAITPVIPFTTSPPRLYNSTFSGGRMWMSQVPTLQCKYCTFGSDAISHRDQRQLALMQLHCHMIDEMRSQGTFVTMYLSIIIINGTYQLFRDYTQQLERAAFVTRKVPRLDTIEALKEIAEAKQDRAAELLGQSRC